MFTEPLPFLRIALPLCQMLIDKKLIRKILCYIFSYISPQIRSIFIDYLVNVIRQRNSCEVRKNVLEICNSIFNAEDDWIFQTLFDLLFTKSIITINILNWNYSCFLRLRVLRLTWGYCKAQLEAFFLSRCVHEEHKMFWNAMVFSLYINRAEAIVYICRLGFVWWIFQRWYHIFTSLPLIMICINLYF